MRRFNGPTHSDLQSRSKSVVVEPNTAGHCRWLNLMKTREHLTEELFVFSLLLPVAACALAHRHSFVRASARAGISTSISISALMRLCAGAQASVAMATVAPVSAGGAQ